MAMRNLFFLLLFCPAWVWAQPWRAADTASGRVRLCFIGDVMQHEPQITGAWDEEAQDYDYMPCFRYISPYWQEADYVIGNLETTLSDKGFSGYPQFCAPWQLARDLRRAGVDILTTNNNHSCDKGGTGVRKTIYYLDTLQIPHTGTFADTLGWVRESPLYIRHGGLKIALLSYTYGTNYLPPGKGQVVSMIDTFHIARQIMKARLDSARHCHRVAPARCAAGGVLRARGGHGGGNGLFARQFCIEPKPAPDERGDFRFSGHSMREGAHAVWHEVSGALCVPPCGGRAAALLCHPATGSGEGVGQAGFRPVPAIF